jgi:hypothetical protein
MSTRATTSTAAAGARAAAPWLVLLARVGYAAKGVVFIVIGALAARLAIGRGGATTDQRGALRVIGQGPAGTMALVVIGVGLLGYMAWRFVSAATDAEGKGNEPTSLALRAASAARGLAYGLLGIQTLRAVAAGQAGPSGGGSGQTRHWTARLMDLPFGRALVVLAGLGVIGYAGYQLYRAASRERVGKHLDLAEAGRDRARWILRAGQFGIAARAVVFVVLGLFLLQAARQHDSSAAGGLQASLSGLARAPFGHLVLGVVALGLVAYGAYQLATARYRHMRAA